MSWSSRVFLFVGTIVPTRVHLYFSKRCLQALSTCSSCRYTMCGHVIWWAQPLSPTHHKPEQKYHLSSYLCCHSKPCTQAIFKRQHNKHRHRYTVLIPVFWTNLRVNVPCWRCLPIVVCRRHGQNQPSSLPNWSWNGQFLQISGQFQLSHQPYNFKIDEPNNQNHSNQETIPVPPLRRNP